MATPPLPAGYTLDQSAAPPPLPAGYKLDSPQSALSSPPPTLAEVLTQPTEKTDQEYLGYKGAAGVAGATIHGLSDVARGTVGALSGVWNTIRHPIETAKAVAALAAQAVQVPGAISDINQSSDPTGTYLNAAQDTASQGAGQALTALGASAVPKAIGNLSSAAGRALLMGKTPAEAYQSALKPSTTIPPARVASMVKTGMEQGIPVSNAGVAKLSSLLEDLQDKVTQEIGAGQGKTVDPQAVAQRVDAVKSRFTNQVNPESDLQAIDASKAEFLKNNPGQIPAADAQAMKVGTYQQLGSKAYGELKTASIEAQKSLARGLKEELANAFPELNNLNAAESKLYDLKGVLEKAVQRQGNHQIMGIGTPIVAGATKALTNSTPLSMAATAMKAVVDDPVVKSRLAIALNKAGVPYQSAVTRLQTYSGALAGAASGSNNATPDDPASAQPQ